MTETTHEQLPPKQEITAEEFIKIWKGEYRGIKGYTHYYVENGDKVNFRGHTIVDEVDINDCFLLDIEFTNVHFEKSIFIKDCIINDLRINSSILKYIYFIGSKNERLSVSVNETKMSGLYTTNALADRIHLYKVQLTQMHCVDSSIAYFQTLECSLKAVSINASKFDHFDVEKSLTGNVNIINSTIKEELFFTKECTIGYVNILNNSYIDRFWLHETVTSPRIHIKDSNVLKTLFSKNITIGELLIENLHHESRALEVQSSIINELKIDTDNSYKILITGQLESRSIIHTLNLSHSVFPKDFYLNISYTDVNYILFESFINNGRIVFNDIRPLTKFERFATRQPLRQPLRQANRKPNGEYIFENVEDEPSIDISNSDLGNTQFIGCDLDLFTDFTFDNSKILSVFIADTVLPNRKNINRDFKDDYEQRKLALSQFKKIYESQGDVVRATQYRAEEMEVYRKQLKYEVTTSRQDWWDNKAERTNLWLNKFSNYYGNNWLKAVGWTLIINAVLFTAYCSSRSIYPAYPLVASNWAGFWEIFPYYFEFMLPIHKTDFFNHIKGDKLPNPGALLIDFISRIILAYMVYQTITAFRKFGKSSA